MRVRTPYELGALIRDHRMRHNLDQRSLAATVGVSRQWIVEIEKGKARAPLNLVLRTLGALGIVLDAQQETPTSPKDKDTSQAVDTYVDINSIVARARKKRK
jgi:HTH-type transcriptional regulator/antitoxin HipB